MDPSKISGFENRSVLVERPICISVFNIVLNVGEQLWILVKASGLASYLAKNVLIKGI